jgi:hypothetical protein
MTLHGLHSMVDGGGDCYCYPMVDDSVVPVVPELVWLAAQVLAARAVPALQQALGLALQ